MLALFMAGVLQPDDSALFTTYEAAVRQAFRRQIKAGDVSKRQISDTAVAGDLPVDTAVDNAFRLAERAGRSVARQTRSLSDFAAEVTGMPKRTSAEIARHNEEAILLSAEIGHAPSQGPGYLLRDFETRGLPPLDLQIWVGPGCATCETRLQHGPGSDQGRLELLDATPFWELDRARALAGTVCLMADNFRAQARDDPDNVLAQGVMKLFSVTALRPLLGMPRMVDARRPESIVFATLAYLYDCRLLKSAARVVLQIADWMIPPDEGNPNKMMSVFRAFARTMPRTDLSTENTHALLIVDGSLAAAEAVLRPVFH
ncbi:hypothetical protein [Actinomadura sp. K4S16]|uniref:hypothetical protein n=1 Tax=Actinomadura sp. K4S16 TaxID=1316147 RepID=UPI0011EE8221|nr:hypothetical protein [Actinomadura sp. K4S16]